MNESETLPDYTVVTDYTVTCPNCGAQLPTTQHNNPCVLEETLECECGKTILVKWSN